MVITLIARNFRDVIYVQGTSYEEVLENIRDAIRLHIEDRIESGEEISLSEITSLITLEVTV